MSNALVVVLLIAICVDVKAAPALIGKWHSDRELSMAFIHQKAKLEDKSLLFLDQMFGRLTLTFNEGKITSVMPDWESQTAEGVMSRMVGFAETHTYKLLRTTETQVAISTVEPITNREIIMVFNFIDKNTMWTYLGGPSFPDLNIREYFVRFK